MRNKLIFSMLALAVAALFAFKPGPTSYEVDTNASIAVWKGYKVTGEHTGTIKFKKGTLTLTDGTLTGGSFEMDMNSITDTDMEGENANKLVGHLKSDDFFGVNNYPTSTFVITRAIPQDSKGNYKVLGDLTIKGTTKPAKLVANCTLSNGHVNVSGGLTIDRSEFNVKYGSGSFFDGLGDKTIYDDFDVRVNLVTK